MEFDIGNILYIVITLVAVLVGVLGKKKKKKQGSQDTGEGNARPGFLENLERMLTMGQENPAVADLQSFEEDLPIEEGHISELESELSPEPMKAPNILEEYDRIMQGNQQESSYNFYTEGEGIMEALDLSDADEDSGTSFHDIVNDFDAKKAVVYSAIINRLDY